MAERPEPWTVDPDDPRAPPQEIWDRLTQEQRQRVLDSLPSEFPPSEACPPEGDLHTEAVYGARTALRRFFSKTGRGNIYVGTHLGVHYPGQHGFSADVVAVLDVPTHPRSHWVVSAEGKGIDFALDVLVLEYRRKSAVSNVERYAKLGIQEYFVFDRTKRRLQGFELQSDGWSYSAIVPQHRHHASRVLGLDLTIHGECLGFCIGDAVLPGVEALVAQLERRIDDDHSRLTTAQAIAEKETERANRAEARLEEALAELERLKGQGHGQGPS